MYICIVLPVWVGCCVCIAVHKTIQIVAFIVVTDMYGYCKKPFAMLFI